MAQKSRYPLPNTISPDDSICYMVPVPNDPFHIAAFKGAIYGLSKPYEWQDDDDHSAIAVGAVWRAIFDNLENCGLTPQFRQSDDCTLQVSFDGGVVWSDIFNAYACAVGAISDKLDDGTLGAGNGGAPGGAGTPGQCYTYKVTLRANERWTPPIAVQYGDTVQTLDITGAWYDGAAYPVGIWNCPDGLTFALGVCGGSGELQGTDPAPTIAHMRLIGYYASETDPYFDMYDTTHAIAGDGLSQFQLQANDSVLTDNEGSINFTVIVCKNAAWCRLYQFHTHNSQLGWSQTIGTFSAGFLVGDTGGYRLAEIYMDIPDGVTIHRVRMGFNRTTGAWIDNAVAQDEFYYREGTGPSGTVHIFRQWFRPGDTLDGTGLVREASGLNITGPIRLAVQMSSDVSSGSHSGTGIINYMEIEGVNVPLTGGDPC